VLSHSRKVPRLARAAIVAVLGLMGFLAHVTLAQDQKRTPPSPVQEPPLQGTVVREKRTEVLQDLDVPKVERVVPGTAQLGIEAPSDPAIVAGVAGAGNESDDPEKAALAFVEQNQKQAEAQLQNLRAEEAKLQARLKKVEAGIKRWESLLGALKQSKGSVAVGVPGNPEGWKKAAPGPASDSDLPDRDPRVFDLKPPPVPKR
jgi:hypothetical protein